MTEGGGFGVVVAKKKVREKRIPYCTREAKSEECKQTIEIIRRQQAEKGQKSTNF